MTVPVSRRRRPALSLDDLPGRMTLPEGRGTLLEGTIGTAASLHAWATLDALAWGTEMFGPLLFKDDIVTTPLRFQDYGVELPAGPGLGIELDEDKLAFYTRRDG